MRPGWVLRRALRLTAENQRLRRDLARAQTQAEVLSVQLEQAYRDSDLLALMCPDRQVALEFVRDLHEIERLGETA